MAKREAETDNAASKKPREAPVCAPSNNLNVGFKQFPTAHEVYAHLRAISKHESKEFVVRNFVCVIEDIRPESSLVETELFPRGALEFYTAKNMGWEYTPYAFLLCAREPCLTTCQATCI